MKSKTKSTTQKLSGAAAAFAVLILFGLGQASQAQDQAHNLPQDDKIKIDGEIEFEIGDTKIRLGSKNKWDGRNHRELEERIYRLERAVQFLMENEGFHSRNKRKTEWECTLDTTFYGTFYAKGQTEKEARTKVIDLCLEKVNQHYCKAHRTDCSEIK